MYSFDELMVRMMDTIPDSLDKRQGSIIYNALAPAAAELAQAYISLLIFREQTSLMTAVGRNLDNRAMDFAIQRRGASAALRIARTLDTKLQPLTIPIGSRFSVPNMQTEITYALREYIESGTCILECEQLGAIGNQHIGALLPIFPVNNLGTAEIIGTQVPGQDEEDDEAYRNRVIERISQKAFGGNIAAYKEFASDIDGIGDLKVYPAWQGGGTVLLSVVDTEYDPVTSNFITVIKNIIDPEEYTGEGIGTAPIGHRVTVTTPERVPVNIRFTATLDGVTPGQVQAEVEQHIGEYFHSLRMDWSDVDSLWVYTSRVIEHILRTPHVVSVRDVLLNGSPNDIHLIDTVETQYLPYAGAVVIDA